MIASTGILFYALAAGSPGYAGLRASAEPIKNLGRFLDQVVGECDGDAPGFDAKACLEAARTARASFDDKVLRIELDDVRDQLHFAEWDARKRAFRLHLTPLFPARASALSIGKPRKLNASGDPIVANIPIWVELPKGKPEFVFRRELERGMVRLELLVELRGTWRFERKDGPAAQGVDAKLIGLRLHPQRGDDVLAEQTY